MRVLLTRRPRRQQICRLEAISVDAATLAVNRFAVWKPFLLTQPPPPSTDLLSEGYFC